MTIPAQHNADARPGSSREPARSGERPAAVPRCARPWPSIAAAAAIAVLVVAGPSLLTPASAARPGAMAAAQAPSRVFLPVSIVLRAAPSPTASPVAACRITLSGTYPAHPPMRATG